MDTTNTESTSEDIEEYEYVIKSEKVSKSYDDHSFSKKEAQSNSKLRISNIEVIPVRDSMYFEDEVASPPHKKPRDIFIETVDQTIANTSNEKSDEFNIFGQFVANELRSLNEPQNRKKLKRMIQRAILEVSDLEEV